MLNSLLGFLAIIDVHGGTGHASYVPSVIIEGLPAGHAPAHAIVGPNNAKFDDVVSFFLNCSVNLRLHHFPIVRMYNALQGLIACLSV